MKGLLLKDIYVVTKQLTIFLIAIPILGLTGGSTMSTFAILLGSVLPMTAIAYDERSKWNELAVMMPYSKKDLIINKYLLGYLCMLGASTLVVIGQLIASFINKKPFSDSFNMLMLAICGGLLFIAINTPILFKFGSEKGRFVFIIAMALIGAGGPILANIDPQLLLPILNVSPVVFLFAAIILNAVSIIVSLKIKLKTI